jgi:hypothetical protein
MEAGTITKYLQQVFSEVQLEEEYRSVRASTKMVGGHSANKKHHDRF